MKVKRFARVMALSLSLALAVPSVVPGAALTAEAASKSVTLTKGEKKTLKVSTSKKITWKSNKTSVATVSKKGVVKAKKVGTAKITATYGSKKKTWKVTVKAAETTPAVTTPTTGVNTSAPNAYPKTAMTLNQKDNTATGGAWPRENGTWNDVKLDPVQASFVTWMDARASKLGLAAQFNYTYHLLINGQAQGKVVDTTGLSANAGDGVQKDPFVYYSGTSYVDVYMKVTKEEVNEDTGAVAYTDGRFYWAVDPQNERNYYEQFGYARDGYGIGWYDGDEKQEYINLRCKDDGTFAFNKAIYSKDRIKRIEVTNVWPHEAGTEKNPFLSAPTVVTGPLKDFENKGEKVLVNGLQDKNPTPEKVAEKKAEEKK